jgi:hypothetical protein
MYGGGQPCSTAKPQPPPTHEERATAWLKSTKERKDSSAVLAQQRKESSTVRTQQRKESSTFRKQQREEMQVQTQLKRLTTLIDTGKTVSANAESRAEEIKKQSNTTKQEAIAKLMEELRKMKAESKESIEKSTLDIKVHIFEFLIDINKENVYETLKQFEQFESIIDNIDNSTEITKFVQINATLELELLKLEKYPYFKIEKYPDFKQKLNNSLESLKLLIIQQSNSRVGGSLSELKKFKKLVKKYRHDIMIPKTHLLKQSDLKKANVLYVVKSPSYDKVTLLKKDIALFTKDSKWIRVDGKSLRWLEKHEY